MLHTDKYHFNTILGHMHNIYQQKLKWSSKCILKLIERYLMQQASNIIWQKASLPSCHPSQHQMHSSINQSISACWAGTAADEQCTHAKLHYSGPAHAPSKMPLPMGDIDPHLWSIPVSHTNDISVSVAILHGSSMSHSPHNLQWTARAPFNGAPSCGGSGPPSNTWFLGHESASQMASRSIHLFLHS